MPARHRESVNSRLVAKTDYGFCAGSLDGRNASSRCFPCPVANFPAYGISLAHLARAPKIGLSQCQSFKPARRAASARNIGDRFRKPGDRLDWRPSPGATHSDISVPVVAPSFKRAILSSKFSSEAVVRVFIIFWSVIMALVAVCSPELKAEPVKLGIFVTDARERPIQGVALTVAGASNSSPRTDRNGKTQITLDPATKPNSEVTLVIALQPAGRELVILSPWSKRVRVPPFDNSSSNVQKVILVDRKDRDMLASGRTMAPLTAQILSGGDHTSQDTRSGLEQVASAYGLSPADLDQAIRKWKDRTSDPTKRA